MTINDRRTKTEKDATIGFVVATDSFLSGWGKAEGGRSLYAVPYRTMSEGYVVLANMRDRTEMRRPRIVAPNYLPKLRRGDHLSIPSMEQCTRFYVPGAFRPQPQGA